MHFVKTVSKSTSSLKSNRCPPGFLDLWLRARGVSTAPMTFPEGVTVRSRTNRVANYLFTKNIGFHAYTPSCVPCVPRLPGQP